MMSENEKKMNELLIEAQRQSSRQIEKAMEMLKDAYSSLNYSSEEYTEKQISKQINLDHESPIHKAMKASSDGAHKAIQAAESGVRNAITNTEKHILKTMNKLPKCE